MHSQVHFQTDFFQPEPGEDAQTNPGCYGRALAHWLYAQLQARGVACDGVVAEDFGWVLMVSRDPFLLWLGCGNAEDSTREWTIFCVAEVPLFKRLFRKPDTTEASARLWAHVQALVPQIPGVSDIAWS